MIRTRVTFRSQNEIAEDDDDGSLRISYLQLGEKVKQPEEDEEWDNPFQPEGEVSEEADVILSLWKEGKLVNEENIKSIMQEKDAEKEDSESAADVCCKDESDRSRTSMCMNPNCNSQTLPSMSVFKQSSDPGTVSDKEHNKDGALTQRNKKKNKLKEHCRVM